MNVKPYTKKDFAWTQWTAIDIKKLVSKVLEHKKQRYVEIKKIPKNERTFENTIYGIESSDYGFIDCLYIINLHMNVSPQESVRIAAKNAMKVLEKKLVDIEYDEGVYRAINEYKEVNKNEKLSIEDKKLLNDMFISYKRMGFGLPKKKRTTFKKNFQKLNKLATDFSNNINEYKDSITVTREELDGLPDNYINGLARDKKGNYIVTLAYPDFVPFMEYARDAKKREELGNKYLQKGGMKNMKILSEILRLRYRNACLLGYKHHADYKTEIRMVKNSRAAFSFVESLLKKIGRAAQNDINQITALKKKLEKGTREKIFYHDINYYIKQLQKKKFHIDSEKIREYFPFGTVKRGIFKIYEKLFSVRFEKLNGYPIWHKDVELYAVKNQHGVIQSYFFLDPYPRANKYGHAAVDNAIPAYTQGYKSTTYTAPVAYMMTNFPKPQGEHPSLLSHREVETFFHEFGHVMHQVLTKAVYLSQSGTSVKRDFVEAPSQMLENWVWDKKMLKILSRHYKTGKTLPENLLSNLLKAKNHMVYYSTARQFTFALFDLIIHSGRFPKNIAKLYNDLVLKYQHVHMPKSAIFPAGFGHLMGYDAGYYGYMWSKVYAADMFTRFKKEGILNARTGHDYRKWILEKGGSREEMDLVKGFLGRKPNNKAFLKEIGL
ncbi:MAG: Zn-dependent oligopeptidase [Candidatus Yonathbacteria bacterium]|nr:Zn-dependent oligopeptidase [Candidatus Yonathbacteria bacterium]